MNQKLSQFSREVVDLLKRMPGCQMPFSKFIPSYHHHFGRQCRVADYGYSKLLELFEAIPHILQVYKNMPNLKPLDKTIAIHLLNEHFFVDSGNRKSANSLSNSPYSPAAIYS